MTWQFRSYLLLGPKLSRPLDTWWPLWPHRRCAALHPPTPSAPCLSSGWCHSSPPAPVTRSLVCILLLSPPWPVRPKNCLCCYTYIRNHFTKALPLSLILAPNTEMIFYISIRLPAPLSVYDTLRVFTTPADWQMVSFGSCCRQGGFGHCSAKVLLSACWHRPQIRQ